MSKKASRKQICIQLTCCCHSRSRATKTCRLLNVQGPQRVSVRIGEPQNSTYSLGFPSSQHVNCALNQKEHIPSSGPGGSFAKTSRLSHKHSACKFPVQGGVQHGHLLIKKLGLRLWTERVNGALMVYFMLALYLHYTRSHANKLVLVSTTGNLFQLASVGCDPNSVQKA